MIGAVSDAEITVISYQQESVGNWSLVTSHCSRGHVVQEKIPSYFNYGVILSTG